MTPYETKGGLIKLIIIIILGVLVLSYFNVDIKSFIESPVTQKNISYITGWGLHLWSEYLADPILYFWNNIFLTLIWDNFVSNIERIGAGESHDFEINAPTVPR